MRLRLLLERICAQYGFGFFVQEKSKFVSSTASDRKGVAKGESVPLDRVLPTFARTKVGPRRAGVQMNTFCKTPRRRRRNKAGHSLCRQSLRFAPLTTSLYTREALGTCVQFMPLQKAPRRRRQDEIWYKGGRGARVRDYIFPRGNPAGRRKKLAPQGFDNLRNVH